MLVPYIIYIFRNTIFNILYKRLNNLKVVLNFAMSEFSFILVLQKYNKTLNDMSKVQIKSEKLTSFSVFF